MIQILIIALFTIAFVSLPIQLALIKRRYVRYLWLTVVAIFSYFMHTKAIEQSYSLFREQLANPDLIGNLLVIQIAEAFAGVLLSIFLLRLYHKERVKKVFRFFKYFPGIMPFISLFYIESYLFLNIPNMEFWVLSALTAAVFVLIIIGFMFIFKSLLAEYDLRLELKFFLHIAQLIIAVFMSVLLFRLPVYHQISPVSVHQTGIIIAGALLFIVIGILFYNYKFNRLKTKQNG